MQTKLMKMCIELAKQAEGKTSPNPLVGCVVLDKNGEIISTGYHAKYGENHAERDALLKINKNEGETLFVNLEPCSHYGKTPPCTDLIIEKGIRHVVIGMRDPNPKVSGISQLEKSGITVTTGVLEDECKKLNEIFIKNMEKHKTFIAIKTATTLDGKTATKSGSSKWITSEKAREEVKKIRNRYDAVLTSSATILADNPTMEHKCKIILDRNLSVNFNSKIYENGKIYLFYDEKLPSPGFENAIPTPEIDGKLDLSFVFDKLYDLGIMSVLVEAGGKLCGSALPYADKVYHFIAPKVAGDNSSKSCFDFRTINSISECLNFTIDSVKIFEPDVLLTYYPM